MNSEDKFREKLNDLIESKEFPFEEDSWKKLSFVLDAERATKRAGLGMFVGGALLVLAGFFISFAGQSSPIAATGRPETESVKTEPVTPQPEAPVVPSQPANITPTGITPVILHRPGSHPSRNRQISQSRNRYQKARSVQTGR
jgi:hypothetical protein